MWEGVGDRTKLQHIDPHSYGHQRFFPILRGCSTGGPGAQLSAGCCFLSSIISPTLRSTSWLIGGLRAHSAECWLFVPHLVSNWSGLQTDWISYVLSYIIVQCSPSSCGRHNFALIQPVHGQGYNILIDRMHLLFTQGHFLFWQPGRFVGQYATETKFSFVAVSKYRRKRVVNSWVGI